MWANRPFSNESIDSVMLCRVSRQRSANKAVIIHSTSSNENNHRNSRASSVNAKRGFTVNHAFLAIAFVWEIAVDCHGSIKQTCESQWKNNSRCGWYDSSENERAMIWFEPHGHRSYRISTNTTSQVETNGLQCCDVTGLRKLCQENKNLTYIELHYVQEGTNLWFKYGSRLLTNYFAEKFLVRFVHSHTYPKLFPQKFNHFAEDLIRLPKVWSGCKIISSISRKFNPETR